MRKPVAIRLKRLGIQAVIDGRPMPALQEYPRHHARKVRQAYRRAKYAASRGAQ